MISTIRPKFTAIPALLLFVGLHGATSSAMSQVAQVQTCDPSRLIEGDWSGRFAHDFHATLHINGTANHLRATVVYRLQGGVVVQEELRGRIDREGVLLAGQTYHYLQGSARGFVLDSVRAELAGSDLHGRVWDGLNPRTRISMTRTSGEVLTCSPGPAALFVGDWAGRVFQDSHAHITLRQANGRLTGWIVYTSHGTTVREMLAGQFVGENEVVLKGTSFEFLRGNPGNFTLDTFTARVMTHGGTPVLVGTATDYVNSTAPFELVRSLP